MFYHVLWLDYRLRGSRLGLSISRRSSSRGFLYIPGPPSLLEYLAHVLGLHHTLEL